MANRKMRLRGLLISCALTAAAFVSPALPAQPQKPQAQQSVGETAEELNDTAFGHYQAGRHAEAEALFRRAIAAFERQYGPDHPDLMNATGNLALTISLSGRLGEAEPLMVRVLEYMERQYGRDSLEALRWTNNLAVNRWLQGRYAEAETLFLRTLEGREKALGRDDRSTLMVVPSLANVYLEQGRYDEAEALYRRAAEDDLRVLGRDDQQTALAAINLAGFYRLRGRYAEAEPLARQALADHERLLGPEHPNVLITLNNVADLFRRQGNLAEAEPMFERLVEAEARVNGSDHPGTHNARMGLAAVYYRQGRLDEAEPLAAQAYEGLSRIMGPHNMDTQNAAELLATIRLGQPDRAAAALTPARMLFAETNDRRGGSGSDRHAAAQRDRELGSPSHRLTLLADAAWAAAAAGSEDRGRLRAEVFAALQEAIAGRASEAIMRMAVRRYADQASAGLGALVRERESLGDQWSANMNALAATFGGSGDGAQAARSALAMRRTEIETRMAEIDTRLRSDFPDYFALTRPAPLDVAAAQQLMRPNEALLLALPTRFGTHVMAVTRERMEWVRSDWTAEQVNAAVQRLRWDLGARVTVPDEQLRQWQAQDAISARPRYDRATAFALYQQLIEPVAGLLAGKERLYVAAGGALGALPFSVLVTESPQGSDDDPAALRETHWFADAHALVHIPSVQSLALLRRAGRAASAGPDGFVGIGDPILGGAAVQRGLARGGVAPDASSLFARTRSAEGSPLADVAVLRQLARLSGTARELESLREAFGAPESAVFLAERATEPSVRSADLSSARVLAFATHGLTTGEIQNLAEPGLVLTPPAQASAANDGYLAASEVSALRLDADWVILSACNTASGDDADGLSGLARAFFYAGARALLASHWPVNDDVAPQITVRTVELQRGGMARAEAFQQALHEVRMDTSHDADGSWAHPFYWAPFVMIGDAG